MDMKVAMLCPFYPWAKKGCNYKHLGGVEKHISALAEELAELGIDLTIITSSENENVEDINGIRVISKRRKAVIFGTPLFNWKKDISNKFDLVHVHGTYPFLSDNSALVSHRAGIPSVITYHFDGAVSGFIGRGMTRIYYATMGKRMLKHDKIIATTQGYIDKSKPLSTVPKEKLGIIPNGVDVKRFNTNIDSAKVLEKYNLKEGYVLFVGRLVPYKGTEFLLEAMKSVDKELVIIGEGPLKEKLQKMGVGKFIGYVEDNELPCFYKGAGVTVLPSVNSSEAFGMVLIESMACGTPVVSTDLPGVKDIATLGGIVVPKENSKALAKGIENVYATQFDSAELYRKVEERFSWKEVAKSWLDTYKSILESDK